MKKIAIILWAVAATIPIHAQTANPLTAGATFHYGIIKGNATGAAAKMPEQLYSR